MGSHLFICFSSKDQAIALEVVTFLETRGLQCWISARDVPAGQNYQETIVHALEHAGGIVFLFSEFSSQSGEIKKELSIGGSINVPVFPLRLTSVIPTGALRYELATRQWIDIFPDKERALGKLVETIHESLSGRPARDVNAGGENGGVGQDARPPVTATSMPRVAVVAAGSPEFEAIRALLARHVGPIAKVLVQKAATEARSPQELCERLAAHVQAPADRAAFLQAARTRLAVNS
jgi:hypothetical protein